MPLWCIGCGHGCCIKCAGNTQDKDWLMCNSCCDSVSKMRCSINQGVVTHLHQVAGQQGLTDHLERFAGMIADITSFELLEQDLTDGIDDLIFKQAVAELVGTASRVYESNTERATGGQGVLLDYSANEDDTLIRIGARLDVEVGLLLKLNQPRYKGLTQSSKLMEGTSVVYPAGDSTGSHPNSLTPQQKPSNRAVANGSKSGQDKSKPVHLRSEPGQKRPKPRPKPAARDPKKPRRGTSTALSQG